MYDAMYWKAVFERAVKTCCQASISLLAAGVTILDIDWGQGAAVVATATALSVLSSIASTHVGEFTGPSLATEALVDGVVEVDD
jgi:hypothetical protein